MDKNKKCSACNIKLIKLDEDNYKKNKTTCKNCYIENKRKNKIINTLIQNEQPKNDNVNTNNTNRTLLVGPNFSGKIYLMLRIPSGITDRDLYIITKSSLDQYSNSKINIKQIGDENRPLSEYENAIIVFDVILGSSNSGDIDQFSINFLYALDIILLSQDYFDLPEKL